MITLNTRYLFLEYMKCFCFSYPKITERSPANRPYYSQSWERLSGIIIYIELKGIKILKMSSVLLDKLRELIEQKCKIKANDEFG